MSENWDEWGSPPPNSKLEQRIEPIMLGEMLAPRPEGQPFTPSPALALLLELDREAKAAQSAKAGQPRVRPDVTREVLVASRARWKGQHGSCYGWLKSASNEFNVSKKTIQSRLK